MQQIDWNHTWKLWKYFSVSLHKGYVTRFACLSYIKITMSGFK